MLRRSARLENSSYYDSEGKPTISYKESLKRVFRGRRRRSEPMGGDADGNNSYSLSGLNSSRSPTGKIVCLVVFLLFVCFEYKYLIPALSRTIVNSSRFKSPVSPDSSHLQKSTDEDMLKQMRELQDELQRLKKMGYRSEADAWPNFALESQGASVVWQKSSETYHTRKDEFCYSWMPFCLYTKPRDVIQGRTPLLPGRCWAFAGERGHLVIALSHPITISHVTLGHISESVSPTGSISSAPKEFSVYGMKTLDDEGAKLGTFLYDRDGDSVQTFKMPNHEKGIYRFVSLQVDSNWGNPEYTCLYNFRVHGQLARWRQKTSSAEDGKYR